MVVGRVWSGWSAGPGGLRQGGSSVVVPRVVRGSYCGRDEKLPNNKLFRWCVISPAKSPWSVMAMSSRGLLQALLVVGAAIASSSFVGVATPTPRLSRHARASSRAVRMMAYKVPQHGRSPRSAVPELGSCASSGRAWRLWAARHPHGGPVPGRPATASGARASRLQSRRCHRV